jgi:multidrug efflux pump subunit AcrA (membrane-fusion protein)
MAERRRTTARRWWARRGTVIGITVAVVALGAAGAWAAVRPSGPTYRTVTAGPGNVTENLVTTGTVQPISQATLSFPVSGQVATIAVQVGQAVTAGQTLASLDTTALSAQVSSAQSTLAGAQARLAADQTSQTAAVTATPASAAHATASAPAGQNAAAARGRPASPAEAQIASAQQDVLRAQQQVDADLTRSRRDLATLQGMIGSCPAAPAPSGSPPPPSSSSTSSPGSDSPTASSTPSSTPPPTTTAETTSPSSYADGPTCQVAVNQVADDENRTAGDVQALTKAEGSLTAVLNQAVQQAGAASAAVGRPSGSAGSSQEGSSPSGSSSAGRAGSSSRGAGGQPATAASLAADQASVDAANAEVAAAQQNLAAATLTSPISGTVAQIGFTPGQSAGQSTIEVVGPGQDQVTTNVSDTSVGRVRVGQPVTVTPDGTSRTLTGRVATMGLLSTSSSGAASFPVTVALDPTDQPLPIGSAASLSIILASTPAGVTVPTSAVQTLGGNSLVSVLKNGSPTPTRVGLGVVGSTLTQIISGLNPGDQIVLANLDAPLPTATNNQGFRVIGGGGRGFGGGGGGGGGRGPGG